MRIIKQLYYWLTAYMPRKLPETKEQYIKMVDTLLFYYNLDAKPDTWAMVAGCIVSTKKTQMYMTYARLSKAGRKMRVNEVAHGFQEIALKELTAKIDQKVAELKNEPGS